MQTDEVLYGLKQALKKRFLKFNEVITSFGFKESVVGLYIYLKVSGSKLIILLLYVDHICSLAMILVYFMRQNICYPRF